MISDMLSLMQRFKRLSQEQDYLVLPNQPWLDGIALSPSIVAQFVATAVQAAKNAGHEPSENQPPQVPTT